MLHGVGHCFADYEQYIVSRLDIHFLGQARDVRFHAKEFLFVRSGGERANGFFQIAVDGSIGAKIHHGLARLAFCARHHIGRLAHHKKSALRDAIDFHRACHKKLRAGKILLEGIVKLAGDSLTI